VQVASTLPTPINEADLEMPCFYLRGNNFIVLFKIVAETGLPKAEVIPSPNLLKLIKDSKFNPFILSHTCSTNLFAGNAQHSIRNVYEDETEAAVKKNGDGDQENEDGDDANNMSIEDLLENLDERINFDPDEDARRDKAQHFTLQRREVIQILQFEKNFNVHAVYCVLQNFVAGIR
jgi:hypothetical protein